MNIAGNQFSGHQAAVFSRRSTRVGVYNPARCGRVYRLVLPGLVLVPALGVEDAEDADGHGIAADAPMRPRFQRKGYPRRGAEPFL